MAYGALASLVQTLDQILHPAPNHILLDKQLIESIKERVSFLLDFLEDSSTSNGAVEVLITRIRDAAYESEDEIYISVILPASESNKERNYGSFYKVLQQVLERMDSIEKEVMKIEQGCSVKNLESKSSKPAGSSRLASSGKSSKVGLDEDMKQIKDRLRGFPSKLEIVPITGMGGIGKTTLAGNIYDDPFVVYHFYIRDWTTVSKQYRVREIFLGLLGSMKNLGNQMNQASDDQLGECLYKSLKGNRYLILMDDLWDTNVWDEVKKFFPDDNNGSRILITTRLSNVALYANSSGTYHQMHLLNETESWNLLREKVFGNECCHPELEEIGKKIARNCQGLPLAIVVIGGHLSNSSKSQDYWEHVAKNVRSIVSTKDEQCLEILSWSYNYLPHHLKACLLYFGAFPAAHEISISKVIKLWAAEGFVKPLETKSLEEAAETHLEDLIGRNLVLVRTHRFNGKIKTCSIHDLLREICLREAKKEDFLHDMRSSDHLFRKKPLSQRRLSIPSEILDSYGNKYNPSVQSLLYFFGHSHRVLAFTANFKLLRVLDMLAVKLDVCPIEIVQLVTLRYLAFIYDGMLPESISKLCNLQTLIFYRGMGVTFVDVLYLPMGIWKMPRLRHLHLNGSALPNPSGAQIDGDSSVLLEKLETLLVQDLRLSEEVLRMIPNLKILKITYTPRSDQDIPSYYLNNLVSLHQLETLKCAFVPQYSPAFSDATLNLVFPLNLKKLTLCGCAIPWKNITIVGSLPNLVALKLQIHAFEGPEWEANEGEFRLLQYLQLEMIDLKQWTADETHFPSLKRLSIQECFHLEKIPSGFGDISTLELIEIDNSSESAARSAVEILEEQQDLGNYDLQVRVHPTIYLRQDIT